MRAKDINFGGEKIGRIKILKLVGQGNWADVYLAEHMDTKENLAVKITSNKKFIEVPKLRELVQSEINILKSCKNPNVVKLIDSFPYKDHQFIVLEYCNGLELGDELGKEKKIDEIKAINYLKQILNGFKGLHEVHAMHRDFKVENVMLHDGVCKIVDLGFGKQIMAEGQMAKTKLGSNLTMAPQVMQGLPYDFKVDIWSIGIVYYQLLYGTFPFQARSPKALLQMTRRHQFSLQGEEISYQSKDFIKRCLMFNPEERINWIDIYHHPLIVQTNQENNSGPEGSHINVKQNISFYENSQASLKKSIAPPSQLASQRSQFLPQLRQNSELKYPMFQSVEMKGIQNTKYEPLFNFQEQRPEEQRPEISEIYSFGDNKVFESQQEKRKQIREEKCIKDVNYLYERKIENIKFMADFVRNQMMQIKNKEFVTKILFVLCLLFKQSYLQIKKLKDDLCFLKNTFEVEQKQFQLFIDKENTIRGTLDTQQQQRKQNCLTYMIYLQQENSKKYLEIKQKIQNLDIPPQQWDTFFNYSLSSFIHQLSCSICAMTNKEDSDRLVKLCFALSRYVKYNSQGKFEKKIIVSTLKKFDYQKAKKNIQMLVKQRQTNRRKQEISKKQDFKKNNKATCGFFSSAVYYGCPFSQG